LRPPKLPSDAARVARVNEKRRFGYRPSAYFALAISALSWAGVWPPSMSKSMPTRCEDI
jgi:hypothetical protein